MLDASDALRAHAHCKVRLADTLRGRRSVHGDFREFSPDHTCALVRFIREHDGVSDLEPELTLLRTAHATVHHVAMGLAQKHTLGPPIDPAIELAPHSNFGAASSSLVTAIRRLDRKLHATAG